MPASVGIVAKLLETLVTKFLDEDQIPELLKRRKLANLKKECQNALARNDWAAVRLFLILPTPPIPPRPRWLFAAPGHSFTPRPAGETLWLFVLGSCCA